MLRATALDAGEYGYRRLFAPKPFLLLSLDLLSEQAELFIASATLGAQQTDLLVTALGLTELKHEGDDRSRARSDRDDQRDESDDGRRAYFERGYRCAPVARQ